MGQLALKWDISNQCNLVCKHCGAANHLLANSETPPLSELIRACHAIVANGFTDVVLLGGEPLLLGDMLFEVVSHLAENEVRVTITTNGTLIDQDISRRLIRSGVHGIIVSVDGDRDACDSLRGIGVFDAALSGISAFYSACIAAHIEPCIEVNTVITQENFLTLAHLLQYLEEFRVRRWHVFKLVDVGRASMNRHKLAVDGSDLLKAGIELATALTRSKWEPLEMTCGFLYPLGADYVEQETGYRLRGTQHCCHAGLFYFYMDNNFRVYPCDRVRDQIGDFFSVSRIIDPDFQIKSLFKDQGLSPFISKIMERDSYARLTPCRACKYLWDGRCVPCALVGEKHVHLMDQCAEVLKRSPDLLQGHQPDRTNNPYLQQFFKNENDSDNHLLATGTLDHSRPISLAGDVWFGMADQIAFLRSTRHQELIKLNPTQNLVLSIALQSASISDLIVKAEDLLPSLTADSILSYLSLLVRLGVCEQQLKKVVINY